MRLRCALETLQLAQIGGSAHIDSSRGNIRSMMAPSAASGNQGMEDAFYFPSPAQYSNAFSDRMKGY